MTAKQNERAWLKAMGARDASMSKRKRAEQLVLHAALQISDWRAPGGYGHWAYELNNRVQELREAMDTERSLTEDLRRKAEGLWDKSGPVPRRKL